ncbi:melatonin receptor type 1B-like [Protopterus annectens]|uniref:melatonin receptor type 1B-like n=1 Tax=Protopterus annectens TaxID=7888 RepID=UPI001CFB32BA|nr:melatonin receptor type 1B-like [Protopterus annectens]
MLKEEQNMDTTTNKPKLSELRSPEKDVISKRQKVTKLQEQQKPETKTKLDQALNMEDIKTALLPIQEALKELTSQIQTFGNSCNQLIERMEKSEARISENEDKLNLLAKKTSNYFVVSLSFADIIIALYPYPTTLMALINGKWTLGVTHCRVSASVLAISCIASVYNITAIAFNRYCCVCHSRLYDSIYSRKNTCYIVCLVWILSVITLIPMLILNLLQYDPVVYSCTFVRHTNATYTFILEALHFVITTFIVLFCYINIWILIIKIKYKLRQDSKEMLKPNELRQLFLMFLVLAMFCLFWGPYSVLGFVIGVNSIKAYQEISRSTFVVCYYIACSHSCVNAIVYGIFNKNFRNEYKEIILSLCGQRFIYIKTSTATTERLKSISAVSK